MCQERNILEVGKDAKCTYQELNLSIRARIPLTLSGGTTFSDRSKCVYNKIVSWSDSRQCLCFVSGSL